MNRDKQQARESAALAIRVLCAAAGDLVKATQVLEGERLPENNHKAEGEPMQTDHEQSKRSV